jgi:hypothetical protein
MDVNELLSQIPLDQLAAQLGVDQATAEQAARAAVATLLGGMEANAKDPSGAASLARALDQHGGAAPTRLADVDEADGDKIVGHVFGDNRDQVVNQLGGLGNLNAGLVAKVLPLLAPFVLKWLSSKVGGGRAAGADQPSGSPPASSGGGLADMLGGLLAGGSGGGGLSDMLGGLTGGGAGSSGSSGTGGLGDLLGGLLGSGRKE